MTLEIDQAATDEHHLHAQRAFSDDGSPVFQSMQVANDEVNARYSTQKDRDHCYILSSKKDELWLVLHGARPSIFDDMNQWIGQTDLVGRINKENVS